MREFLAVIDIIELGAADQGDFARHEFLMNISVGKGRAVGGNQKMGIVKICGVKRGLFDLAGPLG